MTALSACFHCGEPIPAGTHYAVRAAEGPRAVCCAGCEAVAGAILGQGFTDFYRLREAPAAKAGNAAEPDLTLYDHPEVQRGFVHDAGDEREATLLLEGIRCPACAWLIEQALAHAPGVARAEVNYALGRAVVRWRSDATQLSDLLRAVARVGYRATPHDAARSDLLRRGERRDALWRLFVAGFGMMQVMMYALPAYVAGDGEMSPDAAHLMRWASFALTLPVILYAAAPFFAGSLRDLRARRVGMDVTVALGIAVAFGASVVNMIAGASEVWFDSVTMFVFLLLGGRYLEIVARQRAAAVLQHLGKLVPEFAHRLRAFPGSLDSERIPAVSLSPGDLALVKAGETVPADGAVVQGTGEVSEALLSGESRPLAKRPGSRLIGGSINIATSLVMRVEQVGAGTVMSSITRLAERSAAQKPHLARLADRWSTPFMLSVLALAALAALGWWRTDPGMALMAAVAVLIATCPCAFSLATPVALTVATGELARGGVIPARGHAIEALAHVTDVVLDKTGTLTQGEPALVETVLHGGRDAAWCLAVAAALESASEHPLAHAFLGHARGMRTSEIRVAAGDGIEGTVKGRRFRLGNRSFATGERADPRLHGDTEIWLAEEGTPVASFRLSDPLRPDAAEAVDRLKRMGLELHLLSGDSFEAAGGAARTLGIGNFEGRASPHRKRSYVAALQRQGRIVAMIGDGINDAPVIAQADVSIAMGSGTRLAQIEADAVVLSGLAAVPRAIATSRRTMGIVRQNVAWAFAYNFTVLPLALAGMLTPWAAAIGMSASSLLVVLNALRLQSSPRRHPLAPARPHPDRATRIAHATPH